jgi:aspartyl-tRNA(Asn)/glutamyl-tRNA(Gln) amidotransferase subunit B
MLLKMDYEVVIGLEVHAELSTKTKIYCGCKNEFGGEVNSRCCPVCTGMPGTLPILNKKVVEYAAKMGFAVDCKINNVCKQDRKNYFYPDLPKAYQISQFDIPLCENGHLDIIVDGEVKRIGITRIHIEEDAGKLLHGETFTGSLVDYNRCGVPLIEIVSEPDLRSAKEAKAYLESIKQILQHLEISDCKMQEGSIRCDVNVSVMPKGSSTFGTRCEMKNVNSFSAAFRGIEYETNRQIEILNNGGKIDQETRRWDDVKGISVTLRSKEDAHDYRYFPDPDLSTIYITEEELEEIKKSIPELPNAKFLRYIKEYNLPEYDAGIISDSFANAHFFEECVAIGGCLPKSISNWMMSDIARILNDKELEITDIALTPKRLVDLIKLIDSSTISITAGKKVLEAIIDEDKDPEIIVKERGLAQISDTSALEAIVKQILTDNPKSVEDYKKGKTNVTGFLVGQAMKASKGQGNPQVIRDILQRLLEE